VERGDAIVGLGVSLWVVCGGEFGVGEVVVGGWIWVDCKM
jgi:hypothetical protein